MEYLSVKIRQLRRPTFSVLQIWVAEAFATQLETRIYNKYNIGHKEATTAYGISLLYGYGVEKDTVAAAKWFRQGITVGDMVIFA